MSPGDRRLHLWRGGVPRETAEPPLVLTRGEGIYLWDEYGAKYIDAIASLETCAIGHGRPELRSAILAQLEHLEFHDTLRYANPVAIQLAARLAELAPLRNAAVHFASSGSEAVEAALKVIRQYHVQRGELDRRLVVGRQFGYHGCTHGAMALDGGYYRTKPDLHAPLEPASAFVPPDADASGFESVILAAGAESVAAVLIDPMATASGIYPPRPGFWSDLRQICDRHGVLLVADEVITAFGRTGRWFASDIDDVLPDLITVSKGLSSGYMPISAVIVDEHVTDLFGPEPELAFSHGHTYGGHPVACAAALENLRVIDDEGLVEHAAAVGAVLGARLAALDGHPFVTDIRGCGLLYGIELADPSRPDEQPYDLGHEVINTLKQNGVLTFLLHPGSVVFLCPPLVITMEQVDDLVDRIAATLDEVLARRSHPGASSLDGQIG